MIVTLQTERLQTLEQVGVFVEGNEAVDFEHVDRESAYAFTRRTLVQFRYHSLSKADKGRVKAYLAKMTGLSRVQLTRLIRQHRDTGRVEDRRGRPPAKPFERRYTAADIRLLAQVDATLGQMSGPATRAVMRRQFEVFGEESFERLARLSNGHLYNLRQSQTYQRRRSTFTKTQPPEWPSASVVSPIPTVARASCVSTPSIKATATAARACTTSTSWTK